MSADLFNKFKKGDKMRGCMFTYANLHVVVMKV